jgi:hypothetical protein
MDTVRRWGGAGDATGVVERRGGSGTGRGFKGLWEQGTVMSKHHSHHAGVSWTTDNERTYQVTSSDMTLTTSHVQFM